VILEPHDAIVVLTGAGISAGSGIPTFRDQSGLWNQYRPEQLATPQAFAKNPNLVWDFYNWRREIIAAARPNSAHLTLADMERCIPHFALITQNVDGLHEDAGNLHVLEIHGSIWKMRCSVCDASWSDKQVPLPELPPLCIVCGELARPAVVWFGEALNPDKLNEAIRLASQAKLMLVVGTSAIVQPAASLPAIAKAEGAYIVEINPQRTSISEFADEIIQEDSNTALCAWWALHKPTSDID
jgi:NAD-dependent deacetylase